MSKSRRVELFDILLKRGGGIRHVDIERKTDDELEAMVDPDYNVTKRKPRRGGRQTKLEDVNDVNDVNDSTINSSTAVVSTSTLPPTDET